MWMYLAYPRGLFMHFCDTRALIAQHN